MNSNKKPLHQSLLPCYPSDDKLIRYVTNHQQQLDYFKFGAIPTTYTEIGGETKVDNKDHFFNKERCVIDDESENIIHRQYEENFFASYILHLN